MTTSPMEHWPAGALNAARPAARGTRSPTRFPWRRSGDVWMLELGCGPDLGEKPFAPEGGAEVRVEYLDGHVAVVPGVMRAVDGGHAARADLAFDDVATG